MASIVNTYKVIVHYETSGKKLGAFEHQTYFIQAADNSNSTLSAVLSSNGKVPPGSTVVFDQVANMGVGASQSNLLAWEKTCYLIHAHTTRIRSTPRTTHKLVRSAAAIALHSARTAAR